jgi:hypothetical protein
MAEIGAALGVLAEYGVSTHDFPVGRVNAPAVLLSYPERIDFHGTYGAPAGMNRITLPLVVVAGRVNEESASDLMGEFCSDQGEKSIVSIVERASYTTLDAVTVTSVDFDVVEIAGASYLAALFTLDVAVSRR